MIGRITEIIRENRIIPVAVIEETDDAVKIAEILSDHSISIIEITLRTGGAYQCIRMLRDAFPSMTVGAGSVLTVDAMNRAVDSGAAFLVSPCLDAELLAHAEERHFSYVPGAATPSELHAALKSCPLVKIFPASALGGPAYLKAITAPFALKDFSIIPTGGISEKNMAEYLAVDRVAACGMSSLVDPALVKAGDFAALRERVAKTVAALPPL